MLAQFSTATDAEFSYLVTLLTGSGIAFVIAVLGVISIRNSLHFRHSW